MNERILRATAYATGLVALVAAGHVQGGSAATRPAPSPVATDYIHCNSPLYAEMNRLSGLLRREVNRPRPNAARVAALKRALAATVARLG
jgi:hypothetical protein